MGSTKRPGVWARLLAFAALLCLVLAPVRARAGEELLNQENEKVTPPTTQKIVSPTPAEPVKPAKEPVVESPAVKLAKERATTEELFKKERDALANVYDVGRNGGTAQQLEEARQQHLAAKQALTDSQGRLKSLIDEKSTADQALVKKEEEKLYGEGGRSTLEKVRDGLATTTGIVTGMGTGAITGPVKGVKAVVDMASSPVQTFNNVRDALTGPGPTPQQKLDSEVQRLNQETEQKLNQLREPFKSGFDGGQIIGETVLGPVVAAKALGVAGSIGSKVLSREGAAAPLASETSPVARAAPELTGTVQSRVNLADGRTRFTPLRENGQPVSAGWQHVLSQHFNRELSSNRSVFTVQPEKVRELLQSQQVVSSPVRPLNGGQFERTVDLGPQNVVGNSALNRGGGPTSVIKVFTDARGNLITAYPY